MNMLAIMLATTVNFTTQTACHPEDFKHYDTATMRSRFVMEKVMVPDEIHVTYTMYDRLVYGGVMPVSKELTLDTFEELKAEHFLDRRELGVINVGGTGTVTVDGEKYELEFKEALYVGCGKKEVKFASADKSNPAKFYINSAPAYKEFVTQRISCDQNCRKPGYTIGNYIKAGKMEESNDRVINQLIVNPVLSKKASPSSSPAASGTRCRSTRTTAAWRRTSTSTSPRGRRSATRWGVRRSSASCGCTTSRRSPRPSGASTPPPEPPTTCSSGAWEARTSTTETWTRCPCWR